MEPEITLGEVYRNLGRLETAVTSIDISVRDLRTEIMRDVDIRLEDRIALTVQRVDRIEKIVYGAVGLVLVGVLAAVLSIVIHAN